jgi:hypothetical protein
MPILPQVPFDEAVYLENQRQGRTYTVRSLSQNFIICKLFEKAYPYPMPEAGPDVAKNAGGSQ